MKRIRLLREPVGGTAIKEPPGHEAGEVWIVPGQTYEVPDEIAELLTAPRCPGCGDGYLPSVPGLAEEVVL